MKTTLRGSVGRGENEKKEKNPPARETKDVWKKRKKLRKTTEKSKSRGENEKKTKNPPAREKKDISKNPNQDKE